MIEDEFATYDAAYVLGALSPADRRAFEDHLSTCASCAESVAQLAGMPGLLARVRLSEFDEVEQVPVPDTLLPRLLREGNRRRRRTRWIAGGGAALAAAAALVVVLMLTVVTGGSPASSALAMKPVMTNAEIHADAQIKNVGWGSKITVRCKYDHDSYPARQTYYALTVTPKRGQTQQIATWMVSPGKLAVFDGATAIHRDQISRIDIRDSAGNSVLELSL